MKAVWIFCLCISTLLLACDREELPIPAHLPGDVSTKSVHLGPDYRWQIYFDLETGNVVGQNLKTAWDLGFESAADGYRIILNGSKVMYAWASGDTALSAVTDTSGFGAGKKWDAPSGHADSTAFGDWRGQNQVYIVDRGFDEMGRRLGFRKVKIMDVDASAYRVIFSEMDGAGETSLEIAKDSSHELRFLSFDQGVLEVEPPKTDWDICFTQYLEVLPEPYLVTGVLLNRYRTSAAMDSSIHFSQIGLDFATSIPKSSSLNAIGYAWKYYHFNSATYYVLPQMNYLIEDSEGLLYKLHFIDFYDDQGVKGSPRWEYQRL